MYQSYDLSRYVDGDLSQSNSLTVSDHDVVNCAHMLAAGFNTMNRNMLGDFVLAVVDKKAGVVQYDGKVEMINRLEPPGPFTAGPFNFEATVPLDSSTLRQFFGIGTPSFTTFGKVAFVEDTDETTSAVAAETVASTMSRKVLEDAYVELHRVKDVLFEAGVETIPADAGVKDLIAVKRVMSQQITRRDTDISELVQALANRAVEVEELRKRDEPEPSKYAHFSRDVLESAYDELEAVKEVLADAGVETIPADAGVTNLRALLRARNLQIADLRQTLVELAPARNAANEAARAELIEYVKRAHEKKVKLQTAVPDGDGRHDLNNRWRGMLDVLAKFLVVTGEADASEGHAVARRLCGIED